MFGYISYDLLPWWKLLLSLEPCIRTTLSKREFFHIPRGERTCLKSYFKLISETSLELSWLSPRKYYFWLEICPELMEKVMKNWGFRKQWKQISHQLWPCPFVETVKELAVKSERSAGIVNSELQEDFSGEGSEWSLGKWIRFLFLDVCFRPHQKLISHLAITRMKRGQHIFRKSGMPRKIFTVLFSSELLLQSEEMSAFYFLLVVKNPKP